MASSRHGAGPSRKATRAFETTVAQPQQSHRHHRLTTDARTWAVRWVTEVGRLVCGGCLPTQATHLGNYTVVVGAGPADPGHCLVLNMTSAVEAGATTGALKGL